MPDELEGKAECQRGKETVTPEEECLKNVDGVHPDSEERHHPAMRTGMRHTPDLGVCLATPRPYTRRYTPSSSSSKCAPIAAKVAVASWCAS